MEEITENTGNTGTESGTAGTQANAEVPVANAETTPAVTSTAAPEKTVTTELTTVTTKTEKPAEVKIVITHKNDRALVGISKTDFDPIFFIATGDLDLVTAQIGSFVREAREKWQTFQRYPKTVTPPPTPHTATVTKTATTTAATATTPKKDTIQPRMY
jgi:hypothetical protein